MLKPRYWRWWEHACLFGRGSSSDVNGVEEDVRRLINFLAVVLCSVAFILRSSSWLALAMEARSTRDEADPFEWWVAWPQATGREEKEKEEKFTPPEKKTATSKDPSTYTC